MSPTLVSSLTIGFSAEAAPAIVIKAAAIKLKMVCFRENTLNSLRGKHLFG